MNPRVSTPVIARPTAPERGLLNDLQARRESLTAGRVILRRRIAAVLDAQRAAGADAAARRDVAASVRAEMRVVWDEVQATRQETRQAAGRAAPHGGALPARPVRVLVVYDLAAMRRLPMRQVTRAGGTVVGEAATAADDR